MFVSDGLECLGHDVQWGTLAHGQGDHARIALSSFRKRCKDIFFRPDYDQVRACFLDIAHNMTQDFVDMPATIANATHAKFSALPEVLFIDLRDRHLKLVTYSRYHRFYDLAFIL